MGLHVDKGPQVSPWQLQQQLNQGGVGSLHSQMKNCLVAFDLLAGVISTHVQQHMNTRQPVSGLGTQHPGTEVRRVHSNIEGQNGCVEWGEALEVSGF